MSLEERPWYNDGVRVLIRYKSAQLKFMITGNGIVVFVSNHLYLSIMGKFLVCLHCVWMLFSESLQITNHHFDPQGEILWYHVYPIEDEFYSDWHQPAVRVKTNTRHHGWTRFQSLHSDCNKFRFCVRCCLTVFLLTRINMKGHHALFLTS